MAIPNGVTLLSCKSFWSYLLPTPLFPVFYQPFGYLWVNQVKATPLCIAETVRYNLSATLSFDLDIHDHFKLYVLVQDRFTFENELQKKGIEFYSDLDHQVFAAESIRYLLKSEDRSEIDQVVLKNKINTGIESTGVVNTDFKRKPLLILIGVIILAIALLILAEYFL